MFAGVRPLFLQPASAVSPKEADRVLRALGRVIVSSPSKGSAPGTGSLVTRCCADPSTASLGRSRDRASVRTYNRGQVCAAVANGVAACGSGKAKRKGGRDRGPQPVVLVLDARRRTRSRGDRGRCGPLGRDGGSRQRRQPGQAYFRSLNSIG